MPEPKADTRLVIRIADLPQIRLLIVELEALLQVMEPGPERDRLAAALYRARAQLDTD